MEESDKIPFTNLDFEDNIRKTWYQIRNEKHFSDVTLACDGKQLEAHKLVISANSQVFKDLFVQNPHEHPLLYLRGVNYGDLVSMLDYMYFGEVAVDEKNLNSFVAVLEDFKIVSFKSNDENDSSPHEKFQSLAKNAPSKISDNDLQLKGDLKGLPDLETSYKSEIIDLDLRNEESSKNLTLEIPENTLESKDNIIKTNEVKLSSSCNQLQDLHTNDEMYVDEERITFSLDIEETCFKNEEISKNLSIENMAEKSLKKYRNKYNIDRINEEKNMVKMQQKYLENSYNIDKSNDITKSIVEENMAEMPENPLENKYNIDKSNEKYWRYNCDQCNYKITRNSLLIQHKQSKHEGIRHSCTKCEYKAIRKSTVNEHILSVHQGIIYPCNKCEYKANRKGDLRVHTKIRHIRGIGYSCKECDYSGTRQSSLNEHMRSKHSGIRFSCEFCDFKSARKHYVTVHENSKHKGVQYPCDQCDYKTSQKQSLKKHNHFKHNIVN